MIVKSSVTCAECSYMGFRHSLDLSSRSCQWYCPFLNRHTVQQMILKASRAQNSMAIISSYGRRPLYHDDMDNNYILLLSQYL